MLYLLWDASVLSKRYAQEIGTPTVEALFTQITLQQMRIIVLSCTETYAILVRKRNRGDISAVSYAAAVSALQNEVIYNLDFGILPMEADVVLSSIDLIARHNINSTDAAILNSFLQHAASLADAGEKTVLVASDQRLLRAASAVNTLNPELVDAFDATEFLATM